MKVVDYHVANAALLMSLDDVRPVNGVNLTEASAAICSRYDFVNRPNLSARSNAQIPLSVGGSPIAQLGLPPLVFEDGGINRDGKLLRIRKLEVLQDFSMLVAHTSTTDEGDVVLSDLVVMLESTFGFRDVSEFSHRRYGSNIVFEFDKKIEKSVKLFISLGEIASKALGEASGLKLDAKLERLSFGFDPFDVPVARAGMGGSFVIERRAGQPYSANRWFSSALMRTPDHVRTLGLMENVIQQATTSSD